MSSLSPTPAIGRSIRPIASISTILLLAACPGTTPTTPEPQPTNNAPVAAAGADQTVSTTLPVMLDGSASTDSDGDPITYAWSLSAVPAGSAAAFDDVTAVAPTFTPDVAGSYTVQLVVNDGTDDSPADQLTVTAEDNSTSTMVDGAGGQAVSKDGSLTLDIPAGALSAAEDIVITAVPANQYPAELADLGPDDLVYDMKPDGLQFAQPVTVTLAAPQAWEPVVGTDMVAAPLAAVATLSGGSIELATGQTTAVDADAATTTVSAEITHFSWLAVTERFRSGSTDMRVELGADYPSAWRYVPAAANIFEVEVSVRSAPPTALQGLVGEVSALTTGTVSDVDPTPTALSAGGANDFVALRTYSCDAAGLGVVISTAQMWGINAGGWADVVASNPLTMTIATSTDCVPEPDPWQTLDRQFAEGIARLKAPTKQEDDPGFTQIDHDGGIVGVGGGDGASFAGPDGASIAILWKNAQSHPQPIFGVVGTLDDGGVTYSGNGLLEYAGDLSGLVPGPSGAALTAPQFELTPMAQPGTGPDLSAHATDALLFGEVGDRGIAAVLYGDQDIAFFDSGTDTGASPGFVFRSDLATAFKPGGVSIFGATDIPVSVHVQPNGFTDSDPILVITEANDVTLETKIWLVERTGSTLTATHQNSLFPYPGGRRVRCLAGICAVTAYGTNVGFGGTTMFAWDGGTGFTHVQTLVGRAIGVALSRTFDGDVQIATTSFSDDTYTVHLISTAGEYLNTAWGPVPQECVGPGHVEFRRADELLVSCNTSGNVVSQTFSYPATN